MATGAPSLKTATLGFGSTTHVPDTPELVGIAKPRQEAAGRLNRVGAERRAGVCHNNALVLTSQGLLHVDAQIIHHGHRVVERVGAGILLVVETRYLHTARGHGEDERPIFSVPAA